MTREKELKKKLIWKGTIGEEVKGGRLTQEEVDRWNMEDYEGERYAECYQEGKEQAEQRIIKLIKKEAEHHKKVCKYHCDLFVIDIEAKIKGARK